MTQKRPMVSVVTISYNQAEFLERAIQSVLAQEGVDLDYIIVDPGSTDGSRDIIERYRDKMSHVLLEKDDGPADGLNCGLAKASGEYFYYLNADDEACPGVLAKAARFLVRHPNVDVVFANGVDIDGSGIRRRHLVSSARISPLLLLSGAATIVQQAAVVRTSALRAVGGFNAKNRTCWDGEAFMDIALAGGRFRRVWDTWGRFRIHSGSISGSGRLEAAYREDLTRIFRKVRGREPTAWDKVWSILFRLLARLADPLGTAVRVWSRVDRR
jgi:glycosyltransferase involved in cell wall biosynthesis